LDPTEKKIGKEKHLLKLKVIESFEK
jgi:hypothetical protein